MNFGEIGIWDTRRLRSCRAELWTSAKQFGTPIRTAQLIATGQDPDVYQKWNAAQLSNPANTFHFLSTHFVVQPIAPSYIMRVPTETAAATFALPVELGRRLRSMQAQINESANFRDKAHIAFTEWLFVCCGRDAANAPRYDNMGGAVAAGGFFNMLIQNADIVPISDMTGIIEFAGIWKKRARVYGTPSYYAFRMYSSADADVAVDVHSNSENYDVHQGVTRLPEIADVPYLDTVAVLNKAGNRLTLFCVNRHLTRVFRISRLQASLPRAPVRRTIRAEHL